MGKQLIEVVLNGDAMACKEGESLAAFLERLGYPADDFATAINETFVPRSDYDNRQLQPGDTIEVVAPMQGG
jgi:sulfur carrier protein